MINSGSCLFKKKIIGLDDREDPMEKEMATHSSILAWKILRTEQLHFH